MLQIGFGNSNLVLIWNKSIPFFFLCEMVTPEVIFITR